MLVQTWYSWEKIPSHLSSIQGGISAIANNDIKAESKKKQNHVLSQEGIRIQVYNMQKLRKLLGPWPNYIVHKCSGSESVFVYF